MKVEIKLPFLGEAVEGCRLVRWLVRPGAMVEIDQDLAILATAEGESALPSPVDGKVIELCVAEGTLAAVDDLLAVIEEDGPA